MQQEQLWGEIDWTPGSRGDDRSAMSAPNAIGIQHRDNAHVDQNPSPRTPPVRVMRGETPALDFAPIFGCPPIDLQDHPRRFPTPKRAGIDGIDPKRPRCDTPERHHISTHRRQVDSAPTATRGPGPIPPPPPRDSISLSLECVCVSRPWIDTHTLNPNLDIAPSRGPS